MAKDLAATVQAAEAVGATVPSIRAVAEVYRAATDEGLGGENLHAVAKRYL